MIDYATILWTLGAFPLVTGKNSSGPGNLDGTPYIRTVIDDLWGASQALMDAANLTPDAVTESATASQRLEAIRRISGYPGEVISWHGNDADPSALGIRLLPLNGQGILVASYPELDASTWVGTTPNLTASAYFRADDALGVTRNPAGIYLILPDLRGSFMRGLDVSGTIDPDGASRDIGNYQTDKLEEHEHLLDVAGTQKTMREAQVLNSIEGSPGLRCISQDGSGSLFTVGDGEHPSKFNDFETRPKNHTGRWCIRY